MVGLPFLRIPFVAQREIFKFADLYDVITLSFCSQKTRLIVKAANVKLDTLDFDFTGQYMMTIKVNDKLSLLYSQQSNTSQDSEEPKPLSEVLWYDYEAGREMSILQNYQTKDCLGDCLIQHFIQTFKSVKVVKVINKVPILNIPLWKYTKSIDELENCSTRNNKFSEQEIKFICEDLNVKRSWNIDMQVIDGYQYSGGFHQENVTIYYAKWVKFEAITNSTSHTITLYDIQDPSTTQFNNLFKDWMKMEKLKDVKFVKLMWSGDNSLNFFSTSFDGIEYHRINAETVTFKRIDGKMAEVTLSNQGVFLFIVKD